MKSFDPELHLNHVDRANLVAISVTEGFKVLQRIMRSEVDKFVIASINADPSKEGEVLASHRMAKAAAQFYQGLTNRINEEIVQYTSAPRLDDEPEDATEGLIDLGEISADVDRHLGGE